MSFTANFAAINLLVVFGAAVVAMIFGAAWYSPLVAGRKWRQLSQTRAHPEGMQNAPVTFIAAFVLQVLAASLLAGVMGPVASGPEGMRLGFFIAFCIVLPALGTINLFERRPWPLVTINLGFQAGALTLMGFVVGQWS